MDSTERAMREVFWRHGGCENANRFVIVKRIWYALSLRRNSVGNPWKGCVIFARMHTVGARCTGWIRNGARDGSAVTTSTRNVSQSGRGRGAFPDVEYYGPALKYYYHYCSSNNNKTVFRLFLFYAIVRPRLSGERSATRR